MSRSLVAVVCLVFIGPAAAQEVEAAWPAKTHYRHVEVDGHRMFYREAGSRERPTILLLHGYPSSSHTYRELIPLLSGRFHVVAPDNLGSGYSAQPDPSTTRYDFDLLARQILGLVRALKLTRYTVYMQDFGAPVGFRLMRAAPERVRAVVAQNANAYLEGIPAAKQRFFRQAQLDQSPENVARLFDFTSGLAVREKQYLRDVVGRASVMSPDAWTHDSHVLRTERARRIQVALFQDYKTNLDRYPTWQAWLRERQPPLLLVWGERDPVFTAAGARAYLRDVPRAELHLIDAGHFAVEEQPVLVAKRVTAFLSRLERE